jgi:hypothetical protein
MAPIFFRAILPLLLYWTVPDGTSALFNFTIVKCKSQSQVFFKAIPEAPGAGKAGVETGVSVAGHGDIFFFIPSAPTD